MAALGEDLHQIVCRSCDSRVYAVDGVRERVVLVDGGLRLLSMNGLQLLSVNGLRLVSVSAQRRVSMGGVRPF